MKTFRQLREDGGAGAVGSAGPTVTVGGGGIAGAGQPPGSKSGEPGVNVHTRKKKDIPVITPMFKRKGYK